MPVNSLKRLGYGGSAVIDGVQVLITSGNFDTGKTPSFLNPLDISPTQVSRSRVLHADGVQTYACNVSLDVTQNFLGILTTLKLFKRRYLFNVGINDGENSRGMKDCYLTTVSVSGAAGGLMAASLSVMSVNVPSSSPGFIIPNNYTGFQGPTGWSANELPKGYWHSGNTNVRDWSLTMNQEVTPVYLNANTTAPRYLKVGLVTYSLQVTTYEQIYNYATINISTSSFTLTGVSTADGSSFSGPNDLGYYTNTFETAADAATGSGAVIIT